MVANHMTSPINTTSTVVMFACPECGAVYRSVQERRQGLDTGRYHCHSPCGAAVYEWPGDSIYGNWERLKRRRREAAGEPDSA
jgi:predicted RNA-binding Zn-ribbon protein involved in translation (DUF1610 family)